MAYNATITVEQVGPNLYEVLVEETDAGTGDTTPVDNVPFAGTIIEVQAELISGSGSTINPKLTRTDPPSSALATDLVVQPIQTAAATLAVRGSAPYSAIDKGTKGGRLYHASNVDSGSDNVITTLYRVIGTVW